MTLTYRVKDLQLLSIEEAQSKAKALARQAATGLRPQYVWHDG